MCGRQSKVRRNGTGEDGNGKGEDNNERRRAN